VVLGEAGNQPEQCRLAAARGAEQHDEGTGGGLEADVVDGLEIAERLADMFELQERHFIIP
jgi:hypothetical protein